MYVMYLQQWETVASKWFHLVSLLLAEGFFCAGSKIKISGIIAALLEY